MDKETTLVLVEGVLFVGLILGFGCWEIYKTRRDLKKLRAERLAQEEPKKTEKAEKTGSQ